MVTPTATELILLVLRIGVVVGLYVFCGWVAKVVARDILSDPASRPWRGSAAREIDLLVAVSPEGIIEPGQRFPIESGMTMGRDPENGIILPDEYVSARHARIEWRGARLWLEDLGSTNGTRVNGRTIRAAVPIVPGDLIEIGRIGFRVVAPAERDA